MSTFEPVESRVQRFTGTREEIVNALVARVADGPRQSFDARRVSKMVELVNTGRASQVIFGGVSYQVFGR
ncbi:hypothetical protein ABH935_005364 [Catenulispora sp. GAS73]|uniref:hypothetical protein n=1 Tax=Catenulispora sp. GAS73 TaxID=3156269 RepID=UPI003517B697